MKKLCDRVIKNAKKKKAQKEISGDMKKTYKEV